MTVSDNTPATAWGACTKIVQAATEATAKACVPQSTVSTPAPATPNWDAMANSFASLSSALAWGATVIAAAALLIGFAWLKVVTANAKKEARVVAEQEARETAAKEARAVAEQEARVTAEIEARKEAKICADAYIQNWLAKEAPGIIQKHVELLQTSKIGLEEDENATDEMGENA